MSCVLLLMVCERESREAGGRHRLTVPLLPPPLQGHGHGHGRTYSSRLEQVHLSLSSIFSTSNSNPAALRHTRNTQHAATPHHHTAQPVFLHRPLPSRHTAAWDARSQEQKGECKSAGSLPLLSKRPWCACASWCLVVLGQFARIVSALLSAKTETLGLVNGTFQFVF